jgi:hypothetical protein
MGRTKMAKNCRYETVDGERYETVDGENAVEVVSQTGIYRTFTRGTAEPLYEGPSRADAAASLDMSGEEFNALLMSDAALAECWRCGAEGAEFARPAHPDGGGTICHTCHSHIYDESSPVNDEWPIPGLTSEQYEEAQEFAERAMSHPTDRPDNAEEAAEWYGHHFGGRGDE